MGPVVGNKKQEEKISELGTIANQMFPDIEIMVFKGSFRLGIRSALKKNRFQTWEQVAEQHSLAKRNFFHIAIEESIPHLKTIGLSNDDIARLISRLEKEHDKYLNIEI